MSLIEERGEYKGMADNRLERKIVQGGILVAEKPAEWVTFKDGSRLPCIPYVQLTAEQKILFDEQRSLLTPDQLVYVQEAEAVAEMTGVVRPTVISSASKGKRDYVAGIDKSNPDYWRERREQEKEEMEEIAVEARRQMGTGGK